MKIFTDIPQSKKLSELGLPLSSADMFYNEEPDETYLKDIDTKYPMIVRKGQKHYLEEYGIPCWSLAALCDLFPHDKESPILNITRGGYSIKGGYTHDWFVTLEDEDSNIKFSEQAPELIDALVNMIVLLKEKNLL